MVLKTVFSSEDFTPSLLSELQVYQVFPATGLGGRTSDIDNHKVIKCSLSKMPKLRKKQIIDLLPQFGYEKCKPSCKSCVVLNCINTALAGMYSCLKNKQLAQRYIEEYESEMHDWPREPALEAVLRINLLWKIISRRILKMRGVPFQVPSGGGCGCFSNTVQLCRSWADSIIRQTETATLYRRGNGPLSVSAKTSSTELDQANANHYMQVLQLRAKYDALKQTMVLKERKSLRENNTDVKARETNTDVKEYCTAEAGDDRVSQDTSDIENVRDLTQEICRLKLMVNYLSEQLSNYDKHVYVRSNADIEIQTTGDSELDSFRKYFSPCGSVKKSAASSVSDGGTFSSAYNTDLLDEYFRQKQQPGNLNCNNVISEFKISLKNGRCEEFRDISLLQILHKSNKVKASKQNRIGSRCKDPAVVLSRVKSVFNSILDQETSKIHDSDVGNKYYIQARSFELL